MRATNILCRGAKGYSWYQNYMRKGSEGFNKNVPPTPFDWTTSEKCRPKAFFDIVIAKEKIGRLTFELADDIVPNTVENFKLLCTGGNIHSRSYQNTKFHQVLKGSFVMGGDVENNDGTASHSAFKDRFIADENFIIPHSHRGLLSMASVGLNTSGSQFYISLSPTAHMNGRCVVFGRLIEGEEVLKAIEAVYTFRGVPSNDVIIESCGLIG